MANILAIGIATLDIINLVDDYPAEDSEVRALSQYQTRGGNATNTLTVLNQFDHACHWGGVLIDEPDTLAIVDDLAQSQINTDACVRLNDGKMPTSYITVNQQTGSRSIVHHRDCPEFDFADFKTIDLTRFDWVHFEGRNIDQTLLMLQHIKSHHPNLACSLEVEKPRANIERLFEYPSVLFFSQHYAHHHGFTNSESLLKSLPANTTATCTWGQDGAGGLTDDGQLIHSEAFPPSRVVDTLGAGDCFNAAMIHSLINHKDLTSALTFACQLAGQKCGQQGFDHLISHFEH